MSTSAPPSLFQKLPVELLERIFLFTSPQDMLRLSLVNSVFHRLANTSPSIRFAIQLFAVGLQRNPWVEMPVASSSAALTAYHQRWSFMDPVEKWIRASSQHENPQIIAVRGIYGLCHPGFLEFFVMGSVSRGIPKREWKIPLDNFEACAFAFWPPANVVAVAENKDRDENWKVQLRNLDDGEPHPSAKNHVLSYTFEPAFGSGIADWEMLITSSRLVFFCMGPEPPISKLIVWDWTTGEILLDLDNKYYRSVTFVDDYWLVLLVSGEREPKLHPGLIVLNTEQEVTNGGELTQTAFNLGVDEHLDHDYDLPQLISDMNGPLPSREDDLSAPFYPDASQRVLVVGFSAGADFLAVRVEALLRLAREREGDSLNWEEWEAHAGWETHTIEGCNFWVSGSRLYCVTCVEAEPFFDVYDFSAKGVGMTETLPWDVSNMIGSCGCHDSVAFILKSQDPPEYSVHTWSFV